MPIYGYQCARCGPFEAWAGMEQWQTPAPCPACGALAPRALSAPAVTRTSDLVRKAHAINERSSHEPRVERRLAPASGPACQGHGGHALRRAPEPGLHAAHGGRPWMLGH